MRRFAFVAGAVLLCLVLCLVPAAARAQEHVHGAGGVIAEGSGTSWAPAGGSEAGTAVPAGAWNVMFHGALFAQYVAESGEEHRRGHQAGSINWFMVMADRSAGAGRLRARGMLSLEPWTIRGCGYPNLLATGETCRGDDIHDRQHPHELFVELSLRYDRPLNSRLRWHVYGGAAGEPALGPGAFQHRPSAAFNPIAPITHHWLDSTHISQGVITTGLSGTRWRAEVSAFNGREPDEQRTDLDLAPLDSFAGRVSIAPTPSLVMQVSGGRLREAEPNIFGSPARLDVSRATASLMYHRSRSNGGVLATTVAWGVNGEDVYFPGGVTPLATHAAMVELSLTGGRHAWFGRGEVVGKAGHALHIHELPDSVFTVGKVEAGYIQQLLLARHVRLGAGGAVMLSVLPEALAPRYSGRFAPGMALFLSLHPN